MPYKGELLQGFTSVPHFLQNNVEFIAEMPLAERSDISAWLPQTRPYMAWITWSPILKRSDLLL